MAHYGDTYRCSHCGETGVLGTDLEEQYDRYGIYAGTFHDKCWEQSSYKAFVFDPSYAGESLDEDY